MTGPDPRRMRGAPATRRPALRRAALSLCLALCGVPGTGDEHPARAAGDSARPAPATYHVAPSGSDSGPGTEKAPFRTIDRAARQVKPGDVVIVGDGVYTDDDDDGAIFHVPRGGAPGAPVTFRARHRWQAKLDGQGGRTANGIVVDKGVGWVRLEGFEIFGVANRGAPPLGRGSASGIDLYAGGHHSQIVGNHIHDVGRVCTLSTNTNGQVGIFLEQPDVTIEGNVIHDIGRFSPGENGCSYAPLFHGYETLDHGIYVNGNAPGGADRALIRNNVIYATRHGWAVQLYPGTLDSVRVLNNTFAYGNPARRYTHVVLDAELRGVVVANNIFYDPEDGYAVEAEGFTGDVLLRSNLTSGRAMARALGRAGLTMRENLVAIDPLFVDAPHGDFRLRATSPALDAGTPLPLVATDLAGRPRPAGRRPDLGAHQH